ncbi:MAG TPA: hypothetical protein VGG35_11040, partial [Streptosporangiaceae bacterium]
AFAVRGQSLDELAQQTPLVRYPLLTMLTARDLIDGGLRLEPTGRNPRHFTVGFDDLSEGVKGLMGCDGRTMTNPYHYG